MLLPAAVVSMLVGAISHSFGGPISNGDFSNQVNLMGWTSAGALVGEPNGDFAQLETDGVDPVRTLEQSFMLPTTPISLSFDFAFSTDTTSVPGGIYPDTLTASLITAAGDYLDVLAVDLVAAVPDPSNGVEWITGALPIDVGMDPAVMIPGFLPFGSGTSFAGRISLLLPTVVKGQDPTLYFDLYDEFDGASTIAAVDNVSVDPANAMPAPATLGLMLLGLAANVVRRVRRTAKAGSASWEG